MTKKQIIRVPVTLFCVSILICFALHSTVAGQDIKPGASPAWRSGNQNAPVIIEVFNDYQCPPCAAFNEELKRIKGKYKDKVQIIFRNFPLTRLHENALAAAQAAEAAGLQGKFIGMINLLYDNQRWWAESNDVKQLFISYARKLDLDIDKFASDMESEQVRERIQLDIERATSLKVLGTPTILINGTVINYPTQEKLDQAIEEAENNTRQ